MPSSSDPRETLLDAWRTNCRVTAFLVERLPTELWSAAVPGAPRRSVRSIAAHLHNVRARWVRTLGAEHGIGAPALVDRGDVSRRALLAALRHSGAGIESLLGFALHAGGTLPAPRTYAWRNLPLDAGHLLTYFVAHEAHHRGQIVLVARQLGHRLPADVTNGLWQWTARSREVVARPNSRSGGQSRKQRRR